MVVVGSPGFCIVWIQFYFNLLRAHWYCFVSQGLEIHPNCSKMMLSFVTKWHTPGAVLLAETDVGPED